MKICVISKWFEGDNLFYSSDRSNLDVNLCALKSIKIDRDHIKAKQSLSPFTKMMMIQQQGYPKYVGPQISPGSRHIRDETKSAAVHVIKETEGARNLAFSDGNMDRSSVSSIEKSTYTRSPSPPNRCNDLPIMIKRSNSIDIDEPLYDADHEDQLIQQAEERERERHDTRYDSESERDQEANDYAGNPGHNDEDGPLDLSLPAGRRRDRTYSGTESDDSGGAGEEKAVGKAAYKKSLMKRYCKYKSLCLARKSINYLLNYIFYSERA